MREFKTTFWVVIFILISVFIYQNQHFFFQSNQSFRINLIFAEYKTPEISSALMFLVSTIVGFCIAYLMSISGRMASRKKIKLLQKAVDSKIKEISELHKKLNESNTRTVKDLPDNIKQIHSDYR